jgi:hypothetical protein
MAAAEAGGNVVSHSNACNYGKRRFASYFSAPNFSASSSFRALLAEK